MATLLVGSIGVFITYAVGTIRYRLFYGMSACTSLLAAPSDAMRKDIKITHLGTELRDPYILAIRLLSRSRADIPSITFDQNRPIILDVGLPIVALLPTDENKESLPKVEFDNTTLKIGPDLIGKRQEMLFTILVDGAGAQVEGKAYLTNGRLLKIPSDEKLQPRANLITAVIGVMAAGFFIAGLFTYGAIGSLLSILFLIFLALTMASAFNMRDFLQWRYK